MAAYKEHERFKGKTYCEKCGRRCRKGTLGAYGTAICHRCMKEAGK